MTPAFERVQKLLKKLPGLGYRSAERIALHLLVENPKLREELLLALKESAAVIRCCSICSNICEEEHCAICLDDKRLAQMVCVVEHAPDLIAIERSGVYRGRYHVLHGKLSPIQGIGPQHLNLDGLLRRIQEDNVDELILALSNDIEAEATCHYIQHELVGKRPIKVTRIGFGLPSGSGVVFADPATLKSAIEARRPF